VPENGAGLAVSEMVTSDASLWNTRKSRLRMDHTGEPEPIAVQIAGGDAPMLAEAARLNEAHGARIIDINMGCPAKKVCNKAAGSALMRDEALVSEILSAVTAAVDVPVTLKMRTGWDRENRNAVTIARMAEDAGIKALSVHGRTRADAYNGEAEYSTIARVKQAVDIPVLANGDVDSPARRARYLLKPAPTACSSGVPPRAAPGFSGRSTIIWRRVTSSPTQRWTKFVTFSWAMSRRFTHSTGTTWAYALRASTWAGIYRNRIQPDCSGNSSTGSTRPQPSCAFSKTTFKAFRQKRYVSHEH